ncbi:MAG: bifunctional glutamate N-acetyltransferase/amino-acid acetyltransferase ArgJ [Oscillospiraceae bacterium]|jgi:glutamate N-acetyltransferase/amino-acid N-acetyltransferase|nr:bifunctional glutamate N-acetyltransferase/amino-acid acetyltransferase ArgJ [Oscillospiraceae bacterium]
MDNLKIIRGGVCAPVGFSAASVRVGIKKSAPSTKKDLTIIVSEADCVAAAVFTSNKVKGAPITVSKAHLESDKSAIRAIIANSGNANTCNANGVQIAEDACGVAAKSLKIRKEQVLIASTGVIGQSMTIDPFANGLPVLADELAHSAAAASDVAHAIMTTDTVKKEISLEFEVGGVTAHIGGCCKGSGMINPNMATLLVFVTTDVNIRSDVLQNILTHVTKKTFNRVSIDGDTSTNDTVFVLANGLAANEPITDANSEYAHTFYVALFEVMLNLAEAVAADGEGATKLITCRVYNAPDGEVADKVAKSVVSSNLLKAAIFAADANWGRILCAIGNADADFPSDNIDVIITSLSGGVGICKASGGIPFDEDEAARVLSEKEITIAVNLNSGEADGLAFGCDLTYDYVKINAEYRT